MRDLPTRGRQSNEGRRFQAPIHLRRRGRSHIDNSVAWLLKRVGMKPEFRDRRSPSAAEVFHEEAHPGRPAWLDHIHLPFRASPILFSRELEALYEFA